MSTDPLSLARTAAISKQHVPYVDGHYDFGTARVAGDAKTCFRRTLKDDGYCYSLRDVMFFWENINLPYGEYRRLTVNPATGSVAITKEDYDNLQGFLNGSIDECKQIDWSLAQQIVQQEPIKTTTAPATKRRDEKKPTIEKIERNEDKPKKDKRKHESISTDLIDKSVIDADKPILSKLRTGIFAPYTRSSMLDVEGPDGNFTSVLKIFNDTVLKPVDMKQPSTANNSGRATPTASYHTPIIVVPKTVTSEINLLNIKSFLEKGKFARSSPSQAKPKLEFIARTSPYDESKKIMYRVIDDPLTIPPEHWDRVVAVFVTGQLWQFKGWKHSEPVSLFQNVLGVHVTADDRAVDPIISTWNCKVLKVNSCKDHVTTSACREFWTLLDNFIKFRKPHLDPAKAP